MLRLATAESPAGFGAPRIIRVMNAPVSELIELLSLERRPLGRVEFVARIDVAELERAGAAEPALELGRERGQLFGRQRRRCLEVFRPRYARHWQLVLDARFVLLERGREVEDRLAVLDRGHPAHREAAAVTGALHVVDDGLVDVTGAQEIGMQGMRRAAVGHRLLRRRQGLAEHLAAEHVAGADVAALAAEQVVFQALQAQQRKEFVDG